MLDVFYILIASGFIPLVIFFMEKGLDHNDQALEVGGFIVPLFHGVFSRNHENFFFFLRSLCL